MKFKILLFLPLSLIILLSSCSDDTTEIGNWVTLPYFTGKPRAHGACFEFDTIAFFGLGKDDDEYISDFWKYSFVDEKWVPVATFPGTPRAHCASVATSKKGYVGMGYDGNKDLSDFWEYDPIADSWTQLDSFPGGARRYASAFAIGDDVYFGLGTMDDDDIYMNDFWKYSNGQWSRAKAFDGEKRSHANLVNYKNKVYVIGGRRSGGPLSDMWEFVPETEKWKSLTKTNDTDLGSSDVPRYDACTFVSEGNIYLAGGTQGSQPLSTVYEWNNIDSMWVKKTSVETGYLRQGAGSFTINNCGYIIGGRSGVKYLDDFYRFEPYVERNPDDNN